MAKQMPRERTPEQKWQEIYRALLRCKGPRTVSQIYWIIEKYGKIGHITKGCIRSQLNSHSDVVESKKVKGSRLYSLRQPKTQKPSTKGMRVYEQSKPRPILPSHFSALKYDKEDD